MQLSQLERNFKNGSRFQLSFDDHEQIVFCNDKDTGLKAIIGIHNSVMGPALGGTRMFNANEWKH
jgi:leucine dehydrogenase